jgi:hypothetical protein
MKEQSSENCMLEKCMLSYAPIYRRYTINTEFLRVKSVC